MIYGITLIILSLIAVPSLILSKRPDAKELLDKVAPYQGWIGVVFCVWGLWGMISAILNLGALSIVPIWWITWFAGSFVEATLGFILGYGLIQQYLLSKNPEASEKGAELLKKLAGIQGKIGILGIIIGVWTIIASFMWHL